MPAFTRLSNWPFAVKFGFAPGLAVLLFFLLAGIGIRGLDRQSGSLDSIVNHSITGMDLLVEARNGLAEVNGGLYRILALSAGKSATLKAEDELQTIRAKLDQIVANLNGFRDRYANEAQKPRVSALIDEVQKYRTAVQWVSKMLKIDFDSTVSFLQPFDANFQHLNDEFAQLVADGHGSIENEKTRFADATSTMRLLFIAITVIAIVASVGCTLLITVAAVRSIQQIARVTRVLANGDTTVDIESLERQDEL